MTTRKRPSPSNPEDLAAQRAALELEVERQKARKRAALEAEIAALDGGATDAHEKALPANAQIPEPLDAEKMLEPFLALLERNKQDPEYMAKFAAAEWADVLEHLEKTGLPPRFWFRLDSWHPALKAAWEKEASMKLEGWHRAQRVVFDRCRQHFRRKGSIVALIGPRGTGKTTIAGQLIVERASSTTLPPWERAPGYYKLNDLIARFKPLYADHGSVDTERLLASRSLWANGALKVIDELHECDDIRMKGRVLTDLLDRCYSARTDVLIISNQTEKEFYETTSDSVISRISEHGEVIRCEWESFRAKAAARRR